MNQRTINAGVFAVVMAYSGTAAAQTALSLEQVQQVDFGVMPAAPTRCSMNRHGILNGDCVGTGIPGSIEVTGEPYYAYNVSVSSVGWVNNMTFRPGLNAKKFSLDAHGRGAFTVTGELRFKPNFSPTGTFLINYMISVHYQ